MRALDQTTKASTPALDNVEDIYPLTPLQEGMVFHAIAKPGTAMHVGRIVCHMSGNLDVEAFEGAWNKLLARHCALRTAFVWEGLDAPMQVVRKALSMPFRHHDWTALPEGEAEGKFDEWLWQDAVIGFDLVSAPLCRVDVFSFSESDHRFIWACHHAIADGWSIGVALEDLLAYASGVEHALLQEAPKYRSHIAWLLKRDASEDERFWRSYLTGFERQSAVDTPRPSDATLTSERREYRTYRLGADRLRPISAAATSSRVTLNTLFQAAWTLVLSRYSANDDVVFGVISSGRPDGVPGVERMVGLMVTTTPMRVTICDRDKVRSLLQRIQSDAAAIRQHEHAPLTKIQSWSGIASGEALFDCLYVFGNYPPARVTPDAALHLQSMDIKAPSTYPLALLVDPDDRGGVIIGAVTDPTRYDAALGERLVNAVAATAEALSRNLDEPIGAVESLPIEERRKLDEWCRGEEFAPPFDDIVEAIETIAKRWPNTVAVAGHDQELTYAALLDLARSTAKALTSFDVAVGEPVIIQIDRSARAIAAILAVLMAGAAYVPMDPTYPRARREAVLKDCRARLMITAGTGADEFGNLSIVDLDEITPEPSEDWKSPQPSPDTPAYIIYTSGSMGRPKGVIVSRSNLAYSTSARQAFYSEPPKAFLLLSSLSFDSSVAGLFWTLSTGGTLVVAEQRLEQDVERLAALIARYGVTHLLCLPSLYAVLIDHGDADELASLSHAIVAGEACPSSLPDRHRKCLPSTKLINEYGPTESTVWCMAADITDTPPDVAPSIGRPIPGTVIKLVDHRNRLVPQGVAGELMIGGQGVALGYQGQPVMTAAGFPSLPGDDGGRFYRTGDLAHWRSDGTLDYLGRCDGQIKIRGHRIEVSEIEAAIETVSSDVAAVVAVPNDNQGVRLAAFIERDDVDIDIVTRNLKNQLPDVMIPQTIRALSPLPKLPNGKVDRKRLGKLAEAEIEPQNSWQYRAPTCPAEQTLVKIWEKVLKIDQVGTSDDFFALGGDSLASIRIVSLARREGLDVKPTSVLEFPTIEALVRSMKALDEPPTADETSARQRFFLIQGGERMRDCLQDALRDHHTVHLLQDHWNDGVLSPFTSVSSMADDYLAQLRAISPHGPYRLGGYSIGAAASVEIARRLMEAGEEVDVLFLLDPPDNMDFLGGVRGLDAETLKAVSMTSPRHGVPPEAPGCEEHSPQTATTRVGDSIVTKYKRYVRGPFRLIQGSLAYGLGYRLSPRAAAHYAWIVYNLAIQRHKLSPYAGRILVFRSLFDREPDRHYLWRELAMGAYEEEHFHCEHIAFRRDLETLKAWTQRLADKLRQMS